MSYLVVITGSRDWAALSAVYEAIADTPEYAMFMQGGCETGADLFARMACEKSRRPMWTEDALWDLYKLAAGPIRNRKMLDYKPDLVIAFPLPGSKGTVDCMKEAKFRGIEVRVINAKT